MEQRFFDQFFRSAPAEIDVEAIRREWLALKPPYRIDDRRLPLPVWARRGFTETGEQAWAVLSHDVGRIDPCKPFCIYVHIPFCTSRCGFCDCYCFALRRYRTRHIEGYLAALMQEIRAWSRLGGLTSRLVSTVHFGGGTPTFLDTEPFGRLVNALREYFHARPQTEWALESTSSELTDEMFFQLDALGFTRLHIGVQSLEDPVRRLINRRESAAIVLGKIARAVAMGWVVSVDLIFGLPGQSLAGLLNDIRLLTEAGVDGFSLYEMQLSSRNRKFAEQHGLIGRARLGNYLLIQAASCLLTALGHRKTLFNHFAREEDTNLYFAFPERGEDCLALGTIADGVFGDYHYLHPEYMAYCRSVSEAFPALQGGLRRTNLENRLHLVETAILSGSIPSKLLSNVLGEVQAGEVLHQWRESALIAQDTPHGYLHLTANGSWFAGNMMAQLSTRNLDP